MEECEIAIRLQPGSHREEVAGERDGVVLVRVRAPAVDGKANAALCRLMAKRARVGVRSVSIVRGARTRQKVVRVEGIGRVALREALGLGHAHKNET